MLSQCTKTTPNNRNRSLRFSSNSRRQPLKRQSIWPGGDTLRPPSQVGVSSWQSIPRSVKFNPIFIPRIMSSSTGLAVVVVSSATTTATFKVNLDHNTAPQQRRQSGQRSGRHIFSVCAFEKPTLVWNPFFPSSSSC